MASQAATRVGNCVPDEFRGRAYAVFPSACYLRDEDGNQLVLLDDSLPPAPHGISVPLESSDFRQIIARDARVNLESGVLTVVGAMATREAYSLLDAPLYDGHMEAGARAEASAVRAAMEAATEEAERPLTSRQNRIAEAAQRRVSSSMTRLVDAAIEDDEVRMRRTLDGLVGFGPGLTPCGDSTLVGFLAACASCGVDYGIARMIKESAHHTTEISWGFLCAATEGLFTCPLHDLATFVREGQTEESHAAASQFLTVAPDVAPDTVRGLVTGFSAILDEGAAQQQA